MQIETLSNLKVLASILFHVLCNFVLQESSPDQEFIAKVSKQSSRIDKKLSFEQLHIYTSLVFLQNGSTFGLVFGFFFSPRWMAGRFKVVFLEVSGLSRRTD